MIEQVAARRARRRERDDGNGVDAEAQRRA
jgi:hypothetical protein